MEPMKTSRLLAGAAGEGRIITKVNIMADYEIVDWVGEGELLLTTVLALGDDESFSSNLVETLYDKGLAGLAIRVGGSKRDIDKHLIESADRLGFPLIELDSTLPLSDIINALSSHISNRQAALITKLERTHKNLMDIVLNGGGMKEIAKMIYHATGNPVMLKDNIFGIWEGEDGGEGSQLLVSNLLPIVYREEWTNNLFNKNIKEAFESTDNINGKVLNRVTVPILAANNIYGYILLWAANKPIESIDVRTLETASTVMALEITKRMSVYQVESRYKMEFLENLLSRDSSMQNLALERGSFFGWDQQDGYIVMIVSIESSEPVKKGKEMTTDVFNYYKNSMVNEIEAIVKAEKEKALIGEKSDSIILLLGADENSTVNQINEKSMRIGDKIIRALDAKFYKTKAIVGIGRYYENTRELWKSYQEARKAISLGVMDTAGSRVIHFEKLGIYKLLSHEGLENELQLFYKSTIYPLVEYDKKRNTDFIPTLRAYFETDGNLKKMADILFTHYNTILYRLQRIQKIAGIDLKSAGDRLNMEIGLKILNIFERTFK